MNKAIKKGMLQFSLNRNFFTLIACLFLTGCSADRKTIVSINILFALGLAFWLWAYIDDAIDNAKSSNEKKLNAFLGYTFLGAILVIGLVAAFKAEEAGPRAFFKAMIQLILN